MKVNDSTSEILGKNFELSIDDADRLYNAGNFEEKSLSKIMSRAGQDLLVQSAKIPVALVGAVGQIPHAIEKTNQFLKDKLPESVKPYGNVLFEGKYGVQILDKAKSIGDSLMEVSNRTLDELNKKAEKVLPKLSPEEQESTFNTYAQVVTQFAPVLGLSMMNPSAGLNYITALTLAGETEEGFETYKKQNKGKFEGYAEEKAGQDFVANVFNTAVQRKIEGLIGIPSRMQFFRSVKDFAVAGGYNTLVGWLEEGSQSAIDAVIDDLNGRLEGQVDKEGKPLTWMTKWLSDIENIKASGIVQGVTGIGFAAYNRAAVKNEIKSVVEPHVEPEVVNEIVDAVYDSMDLTVNNVVAKELEYSSSLQTKRGDIYEQLYASTVKAIKKAKEMGGYPELETEEDIAALAKEEADEFADTVIAEAHRRNTVIEEVFDPSLVKYENGKLVLPMTQYAGLSLEKAEEAIKTLNSQKGHIEMNYASLKDPEERAYLKKTILENNDIPKDSRDAFDAAFKKMEEVADAIYNEIKDKNISSTFVKMNDEVVKMYKNSEGEWTPIRSIFVNNGDYEFNIDFGTVCVKRQGADTLIKILVDKNLGSQLGVVQLENIKKILVDYGIATACDICFVETKRINARDLSNGFAFEWESVRQALGIYDDNKIGHKYEFTKEQEELLDRMVSLDYTDDDGRVISENELEQMKNSMTKAEYKKFKDTHKQVFQRVYDEIFGEGKRLEERGRKVRLTKKGVEEALDRGITAHKMRMIAKLYQQDSRLAGKFDPDRLMNSEDTSELVHTYFNTDMLVALSSYAGTGTPKALLKAAPYSEISWRDVIDLKDDKEFIIKKLFNIGGVRGQSFSDYDPMRVIDYLQKYLGMYMRGLPAHEYTKEPSLIRTFGKIGVMFNMSIIPEVLENFEIPRGISQKEKDIYIQKNKQYAGLKRATQEQIDNYNKSKESNTLKQDLIDNKIVNVWQDENGEHWTYAWHRDSFPIEEALAFRKNKEYGGRVGIIAVGVSNNQIRMMLNDPTIDMVIPFHSSSMPAHTKLATNLVLAEDYQNVQTTKGLGDKPDFNYNENLRRIRDPKETAKAYLDWCVDEKAKPKFSEFTDEENYYKLLEDFRGYDNDGNAVIQQAVNFKNMKEKDWEEFKKIAAEEIAKKEAENIGFKKLKSSLDSESAETKSLELTPEEKAKADQFQKDILDALSLQRVDKLTKTVIVKKLVDIFGQKNVIVAKQADILKYLYEIKGIADDQEAVQEFRRERDGIIYGFAHGDKIYLNENYMNAHTPAHEFTHIWAKVVREYKEKDPETKQWVYPYKDLWERGKQLLKSDQVWYSEGLKKFRGSDVWNEVVNDVNYYDISHDEDLIASEVLSRIVGRQSELFAKAMMDPSEKLFTDKGKAGYLAKAYKWLKDFFNAAMRTFGWKGEDFTLKEFVRMPFADMMDPARAKEFKAKYQAWKKNAASEAEVEFMKKYDSEVKSDIEAVQKKNEKATKIEKFEKSTIQFAGDKALITLTKDADASTLARDLAGYWLQNTFLYSKTRLATPEYKQFYDSIAKYLGITDDQETIKDWQKAKWENAFVAHRAGRTPSDLQGPLTQYQNWISKAYGELENPVYVDENGEMQSPKFDTETMKVFADLAGETYAEPKEKPTAVRGLAKSTNEMAQAKGMETELPTYEKRSSTEMGVKADEFIRKDKQLAIDIVKGLKPEQDGLYRQDLYAALRELALNEGDSDLLNELSRSMTVEEATELGQRIQALARGRIDPVKEMTELREERMKKNKVDKKKIKEETERASKQIKKEIAEASTPKEWEDFIKSLEC